MKDTSSKNFLEVASLLAFSNEVLSLASHTGAPEWIYSDILKIMVDMIAVTGCGVLGSLHSNHSDEKLLHFLNVFNPIVCAFVTPTINVNPILKYFSHKTKNLQYIIGMITICILVLIESLISKLINEHHSYITASSLLVLLVLVNYELGRYEKFSSTSYDAYKPLPSSWIIKILASFLFLFYYSRAISKLSFESDTTLYACICMVVISVFLFYMSRNNNNKLLNSILKKSS